MGLDAAGERSNGAAALPREHLLRAVLDGTTDAVFVKDRTGRYLVINAAGAGYLGRTVPEVVGRRDDELWPAATARQIRAHDRQVMEAGEARSFEATLPVAGSTRVFLSTKTPYRDADGRVVGLIGISRDITERKRIEQALRESEERVARILESAMDAIVALDAQRTIQLFNAAAEDVFRCSAAEAVGHPFDRFATPALRDVLVRCQRAFAENRVKKRYVWVPGGLSARRADGEEFPIEATISRVEQSHQPLLTLILRDVNERRQAEEELRKLQLENLYLHEEVRTSLGPDEMVGESDAVRRVFDSIDQVAATDATVLITGETGTGKELVARAIHARSARRQAMLVKVNCAALPGGLVESELFGHEKGAFTGALARKIGRFELAHGGTIFLDEIGDLPPELQAKLLRVLQEGEFERVGGVETRRVDVRVLAATNRPLEKAVAEGRFREDLFYRLHVFPIHVPPLRDRLDDIALLARHFALTCGKKMGKRIESIPADMMDALRRHTWPGNVRELQNVIERAVILSRGGMLELGEWPAVPIRPTDGGAGDGSPVALCDLERRHILKTLERAGWRVSGDKGAAALLGLRPTTLESRMKKLGIRRPG